MESLPDGAVDPRTGKVCGGYPNWDGAPEEPGRAGGKVAGVVRRAPIIPARVVESRLRLGLLDGPRWSMPLSLVCCSWSVDVPLTITLRGLLAAQRWLLRTPAGS